MRLPQRPRLRMTLLALAGLLLAAWLIPPFFHAGRYRRVLQSELENRLGRPVKFGAVNFRLLPHPGFSMENVVVEEDPGFGWEPFARVASVECDLRWRSLWGSQVGCSRILLDHPTVDIARNAAGEWNIGTFLRRSRAGSTPHPARQAALPSEFVLEARDARINFTLGATQKPFVLNQVQAQVQFDPASRSIRFDLTGVPQRIDLASPPPGPVELSGVWNSQGAFHATLSTQGSLLYGWIPLLTGHDAGIYGVVDASLDLTGSVKRIAMRGHMHLDQLHRRESLPPSSSMPVDVSFSGSWDRSRQQLMVRRLDATFAGSHIHAAGALTGALRQPQLNMVVAVQRSRLENLISLAARLTGRRASVRAAGRMDGLLTIQGPWKARRYAGLLSIRSMSIRTGDARFSFPEVSVRIDREGAHLVPLRFHPAAGVTCVAQGVLTPALPDAEPSSPSARAASRAAGGSYALSMTLSKASLHGLIRLAAELRIARFRNLDAQGLASATIRLSGRAWPFTRPQLTAQGNVDSARLLVPGLTEPVRLTRFHLQAVSHKVRIAPVAVRLGATTFSGWLEHDGPGNSPWRFDAHTNRLNLQQSSLWFSVLGHQQPVPILDLIPGLRTLAERRLAGRALFSSVNAQGTFESSEVIFRSLKLHHLRAKISIAGRVGEISQGFFRVADGQGHLQARVDFRSAPADVTGNFQLDGINLRRAAWRLPKQLHGLTGLLSAEGSFSTGGLTSQEMSANLQGEASGRLKDLSFGGFDPLQAVARASLLGALRPDPGSETVPSVPLYLSVRNQHIALSPTRLTLSGATLDVSGDYGFDGIVNVHVQTDFRHIDRRWSLRGAPHANQALDANLNLAGRLSKLTLMQKVESARIRP